ncbi:MAG TPA: hypothetical protein VNO31_40490 [Umezawaea sp.]|nr:hypothetical protein [Umezawaea sp.]
MELDVDWTVPVEEMRQELRRAVEGFELWDGRVCVLQVTDAVSSFVRVRALVSAPDAGRLWDLRCLVREHLVDWLRRRPGALPQVRVNALEAGRDVGARPHRDGLDGDARVFGESVDGEERVRAFGGASS